MLMEFNVLYIDYLYISARKYDNDFILIIKF